MCNKKLTSLKEEVRKYYGSLEGVDCPYFKGQIVFNARGFRHLLFKGVASRQERTGRERIVRLSLFKLAVKLLRITTTLQDYSEEMIWVKYKSNKKQRKVLKAVRYWTFVAIISSKRIKVVVRQVGDSDRQFWSVIPSWGNKKTSATA